MTISAASAQAKEAGYRGPHNFPEWLAMKRLDERGQLVIDRLGQAFAAGQDRRERDDQAKIDRAEAKRESARAKVATKKEKSESPTYLSAPDEKTIQAGFKRGLTLNEILRGNPRLQKARKGNPAKFDRCVKEVQARGGAANAYAVCTAAGTRGNPNATTVKHEKQIRAYVAEKIAAGKTAAEIGRAVWRRWGYLTGTSGPVLQIKMSGGTETFQANSARGNPAGAAAEVFEEFHGYAPSEVITVTKKIHYHANLAAAGKLTHLDVWGVDGAGHKISGFKSALLAFNERKNQLFIEGGDQRVNLDDFGIDQAHEFETLGKVTDIGYQTNKTHLGDEGGQAVYVHKFRSTNENGRHVIVKIAREPDLIYDVRNEQLLFSGGSYEILREGIDK